MEEGAASPVSFWQKHKATIALVVLYAYVASLGVVTVNEIFRLDLFWFLTPELHKWVYLLVDVHRPRKLDTPHQIQSTLRELRETLARTRYEPQPVPDSVRCPAGHVHKVQVQSPISAQPCPECSAEMVPYSLEVKIGEYVKGPVDHTAQGDAARFLEEARRLSRERLLDIEEFATLPIFVKTLKDRDSKIRALAFELLMETARKWYPPNPEFPTFDYTKDGFGYDPNGPPEARVASVARWRRWLKTLDLP
jgi:hypothetical protein